MFSTPVPPSLNDLLVIHLGPWEPFITELLSLIKTTEGFTNALRNSRRNLFIRDRYWQNAGILSLTTSKVILYSAGLCSWEDESGLYLNWRRNPQGPRKTEDDLEDASGKPRAERANRERTAWWWHQETDRHRQMQLMNNAFGKGSGTTAINGFTSFTPLGTRLGSSLSPATFTFTVIRSYSSQTGYHCANPLSGYSRFSTQEKSWHKFHISHDHYTWCGGNATTEI
jgi:hypothetical protein